VIQRLDSDARESYNPAVRRPPHRPWLPDEARVVDGYVQALVDGKYATARAAVYDCRQALARVRASALKNGRELPLRSRRAVWCRISDGARAAGRPLRRIRYTPEERNLLNRFARLLAAGRYASVANAARACSAAHERLRERLAPPPPARPLYGIYQTIEVASRRLGRAPAFKQWTTDDARILRRYAKALATGRYPDAVAALADCRTELALPHSADCASRHLREFAREFGWSPDCRRWSVAENRIADRFAKAVARGEYPTAAAATDDCLEALRAAGLRDRTRGGVKYRLRRSSRSPGHGPGHRHWIEGRRAHRPPLRQPTR